MANTKKAKNTKNKAVAKKDNAASKNYLTPSGIKAFVQEVRGEFNKIAWPDKKVTFGLTGFVVVLVTLMAIYLGTADLLLGKLISAILN
ncbi:MAG: preprotein translocase subunit SecE [Desulfobulbus propionicus]|nr:MAG: preprotein translocase subunit SecE [Desulfobulbus propionicus]